MTYTPARNRRVRLGFLALGIYVVAAITSPGSREAVKEFVRQRLHG
jgi:hypothetical protein